MVTMSINDKNILSKYKTDEIISKVLVFFKEEFGIEDEVILCGMDLDNCSSDLKESYFETKSLDNSEFINY